MKSIPILIVLLMMLGATSAYAIPQLLKHQGYMSNNQGTPITGSANVTFKLYTVASEGTSIWTQTISVTFDGGYYSVVLGPGTPEFSIELFDVSDLYLGITLGEQTEFLPRTRIASVPYAFRANAVEGEVKAVGGLVVDGVEVINSQQEWVGLNISFNDLADIPSDLADGDDIGLEGSGTNGTLLQFTESGMGDSVVVQVDGKIGIGTSDPQSVVQIAGGIQIADDSADCVSTKEGALRWHESKLEVCDGSEWTSLAASEPDGQSETSPGASCKTILDSGSSVGDGLYWIDPDAEGSTPSLHIYCDMTTDGGGWSLVVKAASTDHSAMRSASANGLSGNNGPEFSNSGSVDQKFDDSIIKMLFTSHVRMTTQNGNASAISTTDIRNLDTFSDHCSCSCNLDWTYREVSFPANAGNTHSYDCGWDAYIKQGGGEGPCLFFSHNGYKTHEKSGVCGGYDCGYGFGWVR